MQTAIHRYKKIFLIIIFSLFLTQSLFSNNPTKTKITAVVLRDFPPFYMIDENDKPAGFSIDLIEEVSIRSGIEIEYLVVDNWATAMNIVDKGLADLIPGIGISNSRMNNFLFSGNIESVPISCFVLTKENRIATIESLQKSNFKAAVISESAAKYILEEKRNFNIYHFDNIDAALNSLLTGKVDAFFFPEPVLKAKLKELGISHKLKVIDTPLAMMKRGYLFNKDDLETRNLIEKYLVEVVNSSVYSTLYSKWYRADRFSINPQILFMISFGFVVIVMLVILLKNRQIKRINKKLRESETKLSTLFSSMKELVILYEVRVTSLEKYDLIILDCNEAFSCISGVSKQDAIGKSASQLFTNDDLKYVEMSQQVIKNRRPITYESYYPTQNKYFQTSIIVLNNNLIATITSDITRIKEFTTEIATSKKKLQDIVDNLAEWVWEVDLSFKFVYSSENIEEILGYTLDEIIGESPTRFLTEFEEERVKEFMISNSAVKAPFKNIEVWHQCKDGSKVCFLSSGSPKLDESGNLVGYIGVNYDITYEKNAQEVLKKMNKRMQMATEAAKIGIWELDIETKRFVWNTWMYNIFGITPEEFDGNFDSMLAYIHPDDREWKEALEATLRKSSPSAFKFRIVRKNGKVRYLNVNALTIRDSNGVPIKLTGTLQDVTERRIYEDRLRKSEEKFRQIFMTSPDAVSINNIETGIYIDVNNGFTKMLEYDKSDIIGNSSFDLSIWKNSELRKVLIHKLRNENSIENFQAEFLTRSNKVLIVLISARILTINNQEVMLAITRDITERERIKNDRERFLIAMEQSKDMILITDTKGTIQYVNSVVKETTGYTKEEIIGENPEILRSGDQDPEYFQNLWSTIKSGKTWSGKLINKKKDGTKYIEQTTISPVFNAQNDITNFVAVKRDVTEEINLQDQIRHSQKMDSIGQLAGGVAHDFNNMLSVILGYIELLSADIRFDHDTKQMLNEIEMAAQKSANLTKQLLAFARKQTINPEIIDLNVVISKMSSMLLRLIGENIDFSFKPGNNLGKVKMDPSQVDQILANLCVNARDAINGSGKIEISTSNSSSKNLAHYKQLNEIDADQFVRISISDNGSGMSNDIVEKIFDPFFTTKELGKGTGLGLSTIFGIVKQNNGFIEVDSKLGEGTIFDIYIPSSEGEVKSSDKLENNNKSFSGSETILVVEDDKAILKLLEKALQKRGYEIYAFESSVDALKFLHNFKVEIQLVISDVIMPTMNGAQLIDEIKKIIPDISYLLMSGYSSDIISKHGVLDKNINFISKPFQILDILQKIRSILDNS